MLLQIFRDRSPVKKNYFVLLQNCRARSPVQKQTLLFSATMTTEVARLSDLSMKRPVKISVDEVMNVASHLRQEFVRITPSLDKSREALLLALCSRTFKTKTIVFFPLRWQAHRMKIVFGLCALHFLWFASICFDRVFSRLASIAPFDLLRFASIRFDLL